MAAAVAWVGYKGRPFASGDVFRASRWSTGNHVFPTQVLITPTTFSLIHATDFADRYERHLVPLLRAGYLVLCDRYIFTAFGRDIVRGCPPPWVRDIYSFAALPDLTFFFKADLEVSLQHILDGRPQLKYFEAGMDLRLSTDRMRASGFFRAGCWSSIWR